MWEFGSFPVVFNRCQLGTIENEESLATSFGGQLEIEKKV